METRFIAIPTPPALAGRARDGLLAALAAFRNGSPHGTVMPQLALSPAKSVREGDYGFAWARAIWTFVYFLANPDLSIVPREAVEADGDEFARTPTGSGPYRVREFKPGTRLVLERNPDYRPVRWEDVATPGTSDPPWAGAFRGRRFPLPDRVDLIDIPEPTTQLLALERGDIDALAAPVGSIRNHALDPAWQARDSR